MWQSMRDRPAISDARSPDMRFRRSLGPVFTSEGIARLFKSCYYGRIGCGKNAGIADVLLQWMVSVCSPVPRVRDGKHVRHAYNQCSLMFATGEEVDRCQDRS
jgi:hypothetical protein